MENPLQECCGRYGDTSQRTLLHKFRVDLCCPDWRVHNSSEIELLLYYCFGWKNSLIDLTLVIAFVMALLTLRRRTGRHSVTQLLMEVVDDSNCSSNGIDNISRSFAHILYLRLYRNLTSLAAFSFSLA